MKKFCSTHYSPVKTGNQTSNPLINLLSYSLVIKHFSINLKKSTCMFTAFSIFAQCLKKNQHIFKQWFLKHQQQQKQRFWKLLLHWTGDNFPVITVNISVLCFSLGPITLYCGPVFSVGSTCSWTLGLWGGVCVETATRANKWWGFFTICWSRLRAAGQQECRTY